MVLCMAAYWSKDWRTRSGMTTFSHTSRFSDADAGATLDVERSTGISLKLPGLMGIHMNRDTVNGYGCCCINLE